MSAQEHIVEAPVMMMTNRFERAIAKLAIYARADCRYDHSAKALRIAQRLERRGSMVPAMAIIRSVYTAIDETDDAVTDYLPFQCTVCGRVHLGATRAALCCDLFL